MSKLKEFIKLWEKHHSIKALLRRGFSVEDLGDLQKEIETVAPGEKREEIEDILKEISKKLVRRIGRLKEKSEEIKEGMERSRKAAKACIAYSRQEHIGVPLAERRARKTEHKMAKLQEREQALRENLKRGKSAADGPKDEKF